MSSDFAASRMTLAEDRGEETTEEIQAEARGAKVEVVGGNEFDFGTMKHGESMSHEFVFRNVGTGPLHLSLGASTCKCTVGDLDQSKLDPGEETSVKLTWTAKSSTVRFGQSAMIHTNDPDHAEIDLRIKGKIAQSFVIEPRPIQLGSVSTESGTSKTFQVFAYLPGVDELNNFKWTDEETADKVSFSYAPLDISGSEYVRHSNCASAFEVTMNVAPGIRMGPFASRIQFETSLGDQIDAIEAQVTGRVVGELSLFGSSSFNPDYNLVTFGEVESSEGAVVTVWLAAQGPHRDEIQPTVKLVEPDSALQVTIGESSLRGERRIFPLRFEVPKGAPEVYYPGNSPKSYGRVIVETDHGVAKELLMRVRLTVKE